MLDIQGLGSALIPSVHRCVWCESAGLEAPWVSLLVLTLGFVSCDSIRSTLMDVLVCWAWRLLEIQNLRIPVGKLFCSVLGMVYIAGLKVTLLLIWFLIGFSLF